MTSWVEGLSEGGGQGVVVTLAATDIWRATQVQAQLAKGWRPEEGLGAGMQIEERFYLLDDGATTADGDVPLLGHVVQAVGGDLLVAIAEPAGPGGIARSPG